MNWFIGKSRSKVTDKVIVYPREKIALKYNKKNENRVFYIY